MCHLSVMHICGKNTKRHFFYLWYICNNLRLAQKYSFWLREYSFWHRKFILQRWNSKGKIEEVKSEKSNDAIENDFLLQTKIILWFKNHFMKQNPVMIDVYSFEPMWNWIKVIECIWVGRKLREDIRIQRKWMKKKTVKNHRCILNTKYHNERFRI